MERMTQLIQAGQESFDAPSNSRSLSHQPNAINTKNHLYLQDEWQFGGVLDSQCWRVYRYVSHHWYVCRRPSSIVVDGLQRRISRARVQSAVRSTSPSDRLVSYSMGMDLPATDKILSAMLDYRN